MLGGGFDGQFPDAVRDFLTLLTFMVGVKGGVNSAWFLCD
jgi:hypothetical protein